MNNDLSYKERDNEQNNVYNKRINIMIEKWVFNNPSF
jgi:hypothetical protein